MMALQNILNIETSNLLRIRPNAPFYLFFRLKKSSWLYLPLFFFTNYIAKASTNQDTLILTSSQSKYEVANYIQYYPTDKWSTFNTWLTQKEMLSSQQIETFQSSGAILPKNYWGIMLLQTYTNPKQEFQKWMLSFDAFGADIDIYIIAEDGQVKSWEQKWDKDPIKEHSWRWNGFNTAIPLTIPSGEVMTVYYKLQHTKSPTVSSLYPRLQTEDQFINDQNHIFFSNGFFLGLVFIFFIASFALFLSLRELSYFYYATYLLGLGVYYSYLSSSFPNFWFNYLFADEPMNFHNLKHLYYLIFWSYIMFTAEFLNIKTKYPQWHQRFQVLSILTLPIFFVDAVLLLASDFNFLYSDLIAGAYTVLIFIPMAILLYQALRAKDENSYFLIGGLLSLFIMGTFYAADISNPDQKGTAILRTGFIIEIGLFAIGLAYQRQQANKEKQQAVVALEQQKWQQQTQAKETKRLLEIDQLKTKLYTNITHEFRTPLTVIQGMASQIKQPKYLKETQLIQRNSNNLLQLINQLLDLSKLESGKLTLNMQQGNIIPYLRYISESLQSLAANKQINLSFTAIPTEMIMDYDAEKLLQILSNLLSNAIKFTPAKGHIKLSINQTQVDKTAYLQLTITDTGIGISQEQLPYIFDRFYQTETATTRKTVGTGIGLSITKGLVHLLKGTITVNSQLEKGTAFEILLPITNKAAFQTTFLKEIALDYTQDINVATMVATTNLLADKEAPLILLVEDNEDVLYYLITCLKSVYRILTALNGQQGVITAEEQIPDLIISDVMMPEMDGYALCTHLKNADATSHIPIILLTAKTDQASKLEGLQQGADAYLAKPFDQEELAIRITQLLKQRKQLQSYYTQSIATVTPSPSIQDTFIQKVIDLVEQDLSADLPIAKLCQFLHLSQSQVYRKIKGVTGMSTTIFIRHIRLKNAHRLLTTTNLSISEIAYATGFKDPSFFSRSFSEVIGRSPSEVRDRG